MTARPPTTSGDALLRSPQPPGGADVSATLTEVAAMRRAVALSAFGLATTSPNPPVGCVVLDPAGRIVGEGYHERKGEAHAETQALAAAGDRAAGGTAVVTLEPCNHHGHTPPCHQALIDAGVNRVVIAVLDPTSRGEGGAARLRAARVSVDTGVLADEALLVLGPWLAALREGRPRVTWAYYLGPGGRRAVPDDLASASALRCGFDAVLHEDGSVDEGVPGTHGEGAFALPPTDLSHGAHTVLFSLYAGGTRSLLLDGGVALAQPFLDATLIDEVRIYLASRAPMDPDHSGDLDWPLVPPGYRLRHLTKLRDLVVIEATRRADASHEPTIARDGRLQA
jgi:diaminohydroxyphosphoribosylaminopyrimidine deaminase / 5-amino-6-(5-phosphoribosylamino)uracil reductase